MAIALHVLTVVFALVLPEILDRKPILDEIVTVNLVSMPEVQESTPPPSTPPSKPVEIQNIKPAKAKVQIADTPEPEPVVTKVAKPVSIKPVKRKKRKTDPKEIADERNRKQKERERQQALAQALKEEALAKEEARKAREALASMIHQKGVALTPPSPSRSSGGRQIQNIVVKNYLAALHNQVQRYWILPEMKQWDARLETVVVLSIRRDGSVSTYIEKKSKDPFYDQFVMKTIDSAQPLPKLPKMITDDPFEVGLVFKPTGLIM